MGTKHAAERARIQGLLGLGLAPQVFIPALLETLHGLIPSSRNLFDWTDRDGRLLHYYFEGPIDPEINRLYFEEFHNRAEPACMQPYRQALTGGPSVRGAAELEQADFYRSAYYNEIWRPQRLHSRIEGIVRADDGTPLGSLVLYRGPGERRFTPAEEQLLGGLLPYVARGLQEGAAQAGAPGAYRPSPAAPAFLCLAADGSITQLSADAPRLLLQAHGEITPDGAMRRPRLADYPALLTLWRQWQGPLAQAGRLELHNGWGRFVFEACVLQPPGGGAAQLHISLRHHEPEALSLHRALAGLDLSSSQREVCRLLHAGLSQVEIARRLQVSPSTVIDHVRKIHTKLDVHSSGELVALLNRRL
ncbi:LuxR C-terminal-related transcriptional regulator [Inhella proteolytica]|uniref:HTH luxR-type domain-containing protein n=1 Tax=Inhella proteolytica TaxID=2795029 RepID=A0A931J024_9BURK|nr:LuxR C-terminal-related transcriptional regulator [Inhella proteolytica]MBH9576218.1 hypothetical protein [Inhella proteolytica]